MDTLKFEVPLDEKILSATIRMPEDNLIPILWNFDETKKIGDATIGFGEDNNVLSINGYVTNDKFLVDKLQDWLDTKSVLTAISYLATAVSKEGLVEELILTGVSINSSPEFKQPLQYTENDFVRMYGECLELNGELSQYRMLGEEAGELVLAALKVLRHGGYENAPERFQKNLAEEIADTEFMISQICYMVPGLREKIEEQRQIKALRLEQRIKSWREDQDDGWKEAETMCMNDLPVKYDEDEKMYFSAHGDVAWTQELIIRLVEKGRLQVQLGASVPSSKHPEGRRALYFVERKSQHSNEKDLAIQREWLLKIKQ